MTNNYDIRCGVFMKMELNKNFIINLFEEIDGWKFDFEGEKEEKVNCFWREVDEKLTYKLNEIYAGEKSEGSYRMRLGLDSILYSQLRDIIQGLEDDYNFKITYEERDEESE